MRLEAKTDGVQDGKFYAIVRCETAHEHFCHAVRFQPTTKPGRLAMAVVEKATVAINTRISAFGKNLRDPVMPERGCQFCALCFLNTMHRPKRLRQAVQIDLLVRFSSGMIRGEAAVIRRMPILRRDDQRKLHLETIRNRNHSIAI